MAKAGFHFNFCFHRAKAMPLPEDRRGVKKLYIPSYRARG